MHNMQMGWSLEIDCPFHVQDAIIIGEVGGDGDFFWGKVMKCGKDLVYLQSKAYC